MKPDWIALAGGITAICAFFYMVYHNLRRGLPFWVEPIVVLLAGLVLVVLGLTWPSP